MKKLSVLFFLSFLCVAGFAQETKKEKIIEEKQEAVVVKKTKVDVGRIPVSVLQTLKNSYAKHFVTKAYKTKNKDVIYFIELQKNREWFTIAIDNDGRVIREIQGEAKSSLAGLN